MKCWSRGRELRLGYRVPCCRRTSESAAARAKIAGLVTAGHRLSIAPQVVVEFIHVVTDSRRFTQPLQLQDARQIAHQWWTADEVDQAFPNSAAVLQFLDWHAQHKLGRKRLLDTLLAATYYAENITQILTTNPRDFEVFDVFECEEP